MQFRDLRRQYEYLKDEIDKEILDVINSASFISGKQVEKLEKQLAEFVGVNHCITCGNGTDALNLALMAVSYTHLMVVLESTTYPGTTEELIRPILEKGSGLKCGEDFYLGFSPERVDPGNLIYKTKNTPKVVGAIGKDATEVIAAMYLSLIHIYPALYRTDGL